jgi:hypothetical protein
VNLLSLFVIDDCDIALELALAIFHGLSSAPLRVEAQDRAVDVILVLWRAYVILGRHCKVGPRLETLGLDSFGALLDVGQSR